jgi:hypothetical protein
MRVFMIMSSLMSLLLSAAGAAAQEPTKLDAGKLSGHEAKPSDSVEGLRVNKVESIERPSNAVRSLGVKASTSSPAFTRAPRTPQPRPLAQPTHIVDVRKTTTIGDAAPRSTAVSENPPTNIIKLEITPAERTPAPKQLSTTGDGRAIKTVGNMLSADSDKF